MFGAITDLLHNFQNLNESDIMKSVFSDPSIQAQIIDANQSQLYDKGIESDGSPTGDYSQVSVDKYGKSPGHITLKDTGATYDSMRVQAEDDGIIMSADMALHGVDLGVIYPHAIGLTDESISELLPEVNERIIEEIYKRI